MPSALHVQKARPLRYERQRLEEGRAEGDILPSRTGAGNLSKVFREPGIELTRPEGQLRVAIKRLDSYDPTTGEICSSGIDGTACVLTPTPIAVDPSAVASCRAISSSSPRPRV